MKARYFVALLSAVLPALGQADRAKLEPLLQAKIGTPEVVASELQSYLIRKAPPLAPAASAEEWTRTSSRLRRHLLDHIIFHGWPTEWVDAPLKFEDLGPIPCGKGYRMRKLRYEIVPGFWSSAILYEPETLAGKVPAILNVNGHVGPPGKSVEYKQKRCINQALAGMVALNLEWISFGELVHAENAHWFAAHLDLAGASGVGLFYLAMRKGLDILDQHPNVDRARMGMTGLSGGGWQTITLSALDERVAVSVPVAGYSAITSRIERFADVGDVEQNPTDMMVTVDYTHLTAMRAPRPTMLIYNAEDDCCFRAPLVKPYIFDAVQPFFRLYGREDRFGWHENTDPSDHNYQLDNRQQAYRFFTSNFGLRVVEKEVPVDLEIKSYEELVVGLPKDNLTVLGLAKKLAAAIERAPMPPGDGKARWVSSQRERLRTVVRYTPVEVRRAWALGNTHSKGLLSESLKFEFSNGLSATGVWVRAVSAAASAPATVVLNDKGRPSSAAAAADRVNRGEQVLALDLLFTGDASPYHGESADFQQLLAATGDRPLGIEAAQLNAVAGWLREQRAAPQVRIESQGIRSQVVATVGAALAPGLYSGVVARDSMASLQYLLDKPVPYLSAPDLFCFELYKEFDLDRLVEIAGRDKFFRQ